MYTLIHCVRIMGGREGGRGAETEGGHARERAHKISCKNYLRTELLHAGNIGERVHVFVAVVFVIFVVFREFPTCCWLC